MMRRKTSMTTWYVVGVLIASVIGKGLFGYFTELGKTEDWVLEYSKWITAGVWMVCALIAGGFILVPFLARRERR
ncbi:MAG: hypothetical protein WB780_14105 [Candidatus Acidiferrales bacterium]